MGTKLTPKILDRVRALDAEGRSSREIAATLTRELRKPISRSAVSLWLLGKGAKVQAPAKSVLASAATPKPAKSTTKTKAAKPAELEPVEAAVDSGEQMTPKVMYAALGALMRSQEQLSRRLAAEGDHVGAQKAVRLVVQLGAILAKQDKDEEDDDFVKVRVEEMSAAADKAMQALHRIVDRVQAERATWPKCAACGQPHGSFLPTEKSPLRALVERFFKGAP